MKRIVCLISALCMCGASVSAREYHVSPTGSDVHDGSAAAPLQTINAAAQRALAGDTVTVHEGTYREWVNPLNGGESDSRRIFYRVADGETVHLKGSELIKSWVREKKARGVWKVVLPNSFFGDYNPYNDPIVGDWFTPWGKPHTGNVFLNDVSMYETRSVEKVLAPDTVRSTRDPQGTTRVWHAVVDAEHTTIYANFGDVDPNREAVEIAVRPTCFYPTRQGLNYITLRGFHVSQAATQWAAPTAEQVGMIGTHWSKGWIIENNVVRNSRCSGITLGKERPTGHNLLCNHTRLDGMAHYLEVIFRALRAGWNKEQVGSHIVRNNVISDCGQTGICGSLGGAFSEIYGNHIYNIWVTGQFAGAEMGGIKLHGAIDTYIHHNRIHRVGHIGIWLDWMSQGARVSSNLLYNNGTSDLFFEADHGPFMVDNNIMLSACSVNEVSDGGAYLYNLFGGTVTGRDDARYIPYHLNHSTEVKGVRSFLIGDHRFYNNVFVGRKGQEKCGLALYDTAQLPIYADGNLFCNGARPMKGRDQGVVAADYNPQIRLEEASDGVYMTFTVDGAATAGLQTRPVDAARLGTVQLSGYGYENPDGTPLDVQVDFFGKARSADTPTPGPVEGVASGSQRLKVW